MKVRTKAFLQIAGTLFAMIAIAVALDFFFPKFGMMIYMSGVMLYILWCLYNIRVLTLEHEQNTLIDKLKK